MSYSFYVPPLDLDGKRGYCTVDNFMAEAKEVASAYFKGWTDSEQKAASERAAEAVINAASLLARTGVVGDSLCASISGHANPTPGVPLAGWADDICTISLMAMRE